MTATRDNAYFDNLRRAIGDTDVYVLKSPREIVIVANGPWQAYIAFAGFEVRTKMLMQVADIMVYSADELGPGGLANAVKAVMRACQSIAVIDGTVEAEPIEAYLRHTVIAREDPHASSRTA